MSASTMKKDNLNSQDKEKSEPQKGLWSQAQKDKVVMLLQLFLSALAVLIFIRRSFRELISPSGNAQRKYAKKLERREFKRKDKIRKLEYKLNKKAVKRKSRMQNEIED